MGQDPMMVATDSIVVPEKRRVRRERPELQGTKESIALLGIEQPLRLARTADGTLELVAGHGRLLCAQELGLTEVPAYIKDADPLKDVAARVAENFAREALSAAEEAEEIQDCLDAGWSSADVPRITGMSKKKVTERLVLVELPEELRSLYQHNGLPVSTAKALKEIHDANPQIAAVIGEVARSRPDAIAHGLEEGFGRVLGQLGSLMREAGVKGQPPFIASLRRGDSWGQRLAWDPSDRRSIKLKGANGKWFKERWEQQSRSYERPAIQLSDEDLDQAVAIGVAFAEEGEYGRVWIHDRDWLTAHVNDYVLPRIREAAEAAAAATKKATKAGGGDLTKISAFDLARRLRAKFTRELKPRAHAANLDLGYALLNELSQVKMTRDVAVFFAYEVLGRPSGSGPYGGMEIKARKIAECAARVMPSWVSVEKKQLKKGIRETPVYLDGPAAEKRMWGFIDDAKTPEEVLGRTLIVLAAAARFQRECGAHGKTPLQHLADNGKARKAFDRIISKVIPPAVKRLEREKKAFDADAEAKRQIEEAKAAKRTERQEPADAESAGAQTAGEAHEQRPSAGEHESPIAPGDGGQEPEAIEPGAGDELDGDDGLDELQAAELEAGDEPLNGEDAEDELAQAA